jgi:hypothetical protein
MHFSSLEGCQCLFIPFCFISFPPLPFRLFFLSFIYYLLSHFSLSSLFYLSLLVFFVVFFAFFPCGLFSFFLSLEEHADDNAPDAPDDQDSNYNTAGLTK